MTDQGAARARAYHNRAMAIMDQADLHTRQGTPDPVLRRRACYYEIQAARLVPPDVEPSRSVLYRSAAWMAIEAQEPGLALTLIDRGLAGNPPAEIKAELGEALVAALELWKQEG